MSEQFWPSTWFLPLPISKLMAMKLLALGPQINATQYFLSVQICGVLKHDFTYCSYASNIIATLKADGWQTCPCILNLDSCAAACIYGAEQSVTVPLLWTAEDNWMDVFRQKLPAQVSVRLRLCTCFQVSFNPEQICYMCCSAVTSFWGLTGKGNRFYLYDCC